MIKAFLSHSSKDKEKYVRVVTRYLDKYDIVYDEMTFEEGEKPIDEIIKAFDETELFVVFLSNESLESPWVQKEIFMAKDKLDRKEIQKIYPIIIDHDINYKDERIPEWMKKEYNIKTITKPSTVARRIEQKLIKISWDLKPKIKERELVFIGRNKLVDEFEVRTISFTKKKPKVVIASGLDSIGRRSFLKHAFKRTNISDENYNYLSIILNEEESIEDFILKLNDFGYGEYNDDLKNMLHKSIDSKISLAVQILSLIQASNEKLLILDNGCIVTHNREVTSWFEKIVENQKIDNYPLICCASHYKINNFNSDFNENIYCVNIPELNESERARLFNRLLEVYNLKEKISKDEYDILLGNFYGFPEQIQYAIELINRNGIKQVIKELYQITEYNNEKASFLLKKYLDNETVLDFIRLIAEIKIVNIKLLFEIVNKEDYEKILLDLISENLCEYFGQDSEYIYLNNAISSYILRNRIKLNDSLRTALRKHIQSVIYEDDIFERDSSDYTYSVKTALTEGVSINDSYLFPSHFLKCIKDLYYSKKYARVIDLSDKALENQGTMDSLVYQDILYYKCLALARTRNDNVLNVVQKINGPQHDFILGFYYRVVRRYNDALERFDKINDNYLVRSRVRREIVQIYIQTEEFEKALELAHKNYIENKGNIFHIHAYFYCLIFSKDSYRSKDVLETLINELKNIDTKVSDEMYRRCKALYEAFILNDDYNSLNTINDSLSIYIDNHYSLLTKVEIAYKFRDIYNMKDALDALDKLVENKRISKSNFAKQKAFYLALIGKKENAKILINTELRGYPQNAKNRILQKIDRISSM